MRPELSHAAMLGGVGACLPICPLHPGVPLVDCWRTKETGPSLPASHVIPGISQASQGCPGSRRQGSTLWKESQVNRQLQASQQLQQMDPNSRGCSVGESPVGALRSTWQAPVRLHREPLCGYSLLSGPLSASCSLAEQGLHFPLSLEACRTPSLCEVGRLFILGAALKSVA